MTKSPVTPSSPTVSSVFGAFLQRLEADKTCNEEALENLKKAIEQQVLDPQSLRDALFKDPHGEKT